MVLGRIDGGAPFAPLTASAYDTNAKVSPPLRSQSDVESVVQGLRDGVIDFVATDHAPHNQVDKMCTFSEAAFGISVLETALGSLMSLVHKGRIPLPVLIEKLTWAPGKFLGRDLALCAGRSRRRHHLRPGRRVGRGHRPVRLEGEGHAADGATLKGRVVETIVGGEVIPRGREQRCVAPPP